MKRPICVLGGGAMGTACAVVLNEQPNHDVRLWARNPTFAQHIHETRYNSRLLPSVKVPQEIVVTSDAQMALQNAEIVVVCIPTKAIKNALQGLSNWIPQEATIVSAVKGIHAESLTRPSEMIREVLGSSSVVALGGPCHAEEVACAKPASVVAASDDAEAAEMVQQAFATNTLRVYSNSDLLGVELGGALKNVIAIAAGIGDGLQFGDNAKSALITRGLAEMVRFGSELGACVDTFYGLAGIGDLIGTCGSRHSRNRHVGQLLGEGQSLTDIEASMPAVAEGVFTARSIVSIAQERNIEMPIATEVSRVLFENKPARDATVELMRRPLKGE